MELFLSKEKFIKLSSYDIIAVTGPMAAGKNYICSKLEHHNYASIDADIAAHEAIEISTPKILETFSPIAKKKGISLIDEKTQKLDRRALGSILFSDEKLLKKQEDIVYPVINKIIEEFIKNNSDKKIIINATVLYKTPSLMDKCEAIVYVTAPFFTRLKRAKKRDGRSYKEILKRFYAQKSLFNEYKKTGKEIFIVHNNKKSL